MYLIDKKNNRCQKIEEKTFSQLEFTERYNLQEWFADDPKMFGEDLLIIQKEFDGFSDTKERLDLLALDENGNLVIIENKLDDSGRDVTWQALKYASYCSSLNTEDIRDIYQAYLTKNGCAETAESKLCDFFGKEFDELLLNVGTTQRIFLVAAKFRKEVTSTVLWLMKFNLKIHCFKVTPYQHGNDLFLDIEQIIPIKDAEEYTIVINRKTEEDSQTEKKLAYRYQLRELFWAELLKDMNSKSDLFKNIAPRKDSGIGIGAGISGIAYNFVITRHGARVELYINNSNKDKNKTIFDYLLTKKDVIEKTLNRPLEWSRLDNGDASRIYAGVDYNYFEKESWPNLIESLSATMIDFQNAMSPHLQEFKNISKI